MPHHEQGNVLEQLRFVLGEDSLFEDTKKAICQHVASLVGPQHFAFILVYMDDALAYVSEQFN